MDCYCSRGFTSDGHRCTIGSLSFATVGFSHWIPDCGNHSFDAGESPATLSGHRRPWWRSIQDRSSCSFFTFFDSHASHPFQRGDSTQFIDRIDFKAKSGIGVSLIITSIDNHLKGHESNTAYYMDLHIWSHRNMA